MLYKRKFPTDEHDIQPEHLDAESMIHSAQWILRTMSKKLAPEHSKAKALTK